MTETVIIGSGIAGLSAALALAPEPVRLMTAGRIGWGSSSLLAQGGLAASLGDDDGPALHAADTVAAGAGLTDPAVARRVAAAAADAIRFLEGHGVIFDRAASGGFALGLEAAHGCRRIAHAGGDATGAAIVAALAAAVARTPSVTVMEETEILSLLTADGHVSGLTGLRNGQPFTLRASRIVLATGGLGGLYDATTNPAGSFGQGIALAARAGARLADMEFVQFHPTALAVAGHRLPLVSEAVRGEGAILVNDRGERFMAGIDGAELAPRDVVARAIAGEIAAGRRVFLDASRALGARFGDRFPAIDALCRAQGIDPATDPIPVRPAAHYHMGGVATDLAGRTSIAGLFAIGEVAATGLHGANRLASNSLLEAVVMARMLADHLKETPSPALTRDRHALPPTNAALRPDPAPIRPLVSARLGLLRDGDGLAGAMATLRPLATLPGPARDPAIVALLIAVFAALRPESRGAHAREDAAQTLPQARRRFLTLAETLDHAASRDRAA